MSSHNVCNRRADKEILLLQAKLFALCVIVVGVEDLADSRCIGIERKCVSIVALVKQLHINSRAFGLVQTKKADTLSAPTRNVHIIGNGIYGIVVLMLEQMIVVFPGFFNLTAKTNLNGSVLTALKPNLAAGKPIVCKLGLPSVNNLLTEDAVFVADAVSRSRNFKRSQRIKITSCESSQTAVTETCIRLTSIDVLNVDSHILQNTDNLIVNTKVVYAVFEGTTHQKFHAEIINLFVSVTCLVGNKLFVLFAEQVFDHLGGSLVDELVGSTGRLRIVFFIKNFGELFFKLFFGH